MAAYVFERSLKEIKVYTIEGKTLDEVLTSVRSVVGETTTEMYGDIYDILNTGTIVIRYDHEFSNWIAEVVVQLQY